MKRRARIITLAIVVCGLALLGQPNTSLDKLAGIKTKADMDALVAKIRRSELKGPQALFEREKGQYRIYTSYIENRKGAADIHNTDDEVFLILSGSAEVTLGGDVMDKKVTGENEFRGTLIIGGTTASVGVGDIISIPRGTAHQMNPGTGHVLYLVIKIIGSH